MSYTSFDGSIFKPEKPMDERLYDLENHGLDTFTLTARVDSERLARDSVADKRVPIFDRFQLCVVQHFPSTGRFFATSAYSGMAEELVVKSNLDKAIESKAKALPSGAYQLKDIYVTPTSTGVSIYHHTAGEDLYWRPAWQDSDCEEKVHLFEEPKLPDGVFKLLGGINGLPVDRSTRDLWRLVALDKEYCMITIAGESN